jgi:hypothetical protein
LEALCALVRRVQPGHGPDRAVFRRQHVARLLSVRPKGLRARLQRQAVEGGWTVTELEERMAGRLGRRSAGGQRRRLLEGRVGLLAQLERMCESWRRWRAALGGPPDRLRDLPRPVRARLERTTRGLAALQQTAEAALGAARTGRAARGARRAE